MAKERDDQDQGQEQDLQSSSFDPPQFPPFSSFSVPSANSGDQLSATQLLADIPFRAIIANPLVAAIEAQALAAGSSLRYILSVLYGQDLFGYEYSGYANTWAQGLGGGTPQQVMYVSLGFSRNGQQVTIKVPLLVLVPIPYLNIDSMYINFTADINATSSFSETDSSSDTTSESGQGSLNFLFWHANFNGAYSSKRSSTATAKSKYAVEYNMDVKVHASGEDMPQGTAKILNLLVHSLDNDNQYY
ncbi:MAG: DUF2589 domain-containing protein [Chitinophagales bacterium]|nr:DUF2589 domain-containing protein [Chitinophagales bacterium]